MGQADFFHCGTRYELVRLDVVVASASRQAAKPALHRSARIEAPRSNWRFDVSVSCLFADLNG